MLLKTYQVNLNLNDNALLLELRDLITTTHKKRTTYDELRYNMISKADASLTDSSKIVCIYSRKEASSKWDGGDTWNREHVWPKSHGSLGESGPGADAHMLRASDPSVNSTRGNRKY